jgi:hypothetical protein
MATASMWWTSGPPPCLQCRQAGARSQRLLDAVYLTHLHGDHLGGLALLYIDLLFIRRRTRPLLIAGPPGSEARVMALLDTAYPSVVAKGAPFELRVLGVARARRRRDTMKRRRITQHPGQTRHPGGGQLAAHRGRGRKSACVQRGYGLAARAARAEMAQGADVFVCECSMEHAVFWGHMSLEEIRTPPRRAAGGAGACPTWAMSRGWRRWPRRRRWG